ncbi:hypothetical protein MHX53_05855 [Brevibacterium sp. ACRRH]|uniref:hypothetical protein n=1 Tax=Brevibacterium sp. ACRRH TaxID=2918183 RepID=UPI001EF6C8F6|nr:hypothetical protein [Brevibacterium sp. ACRRH]MCG7298575.1 hypothetical protein [Brevibacterium sp. ACRRH]
MARIKQRYLDELEHEFNTTGQVTLRVRPIAKILRWVVYSLGALVAWPGSVIALWVNYVEGTWKDPRTWIMLVCIVAFALLVPVGVVIEIIQFIRPRPQDRLETRDWVITREGICPPDAARTSEEIPPLFYAWDGIHDIDAKQFPHKWPWPPYTAIIAPDVHTVERVQTERPYIKGKWLYVPLNGIPWFAHFSRTIRPDSHITWVHTPDARTLASFLQTCKKRYSLSAQNH